LAIESRRNLDPVRSGEPGAYVLTGSFAGIGGTRRALATGGSGIDETL
jgi:hypothetical protein